MKLILILLTTFTLGVNIANAEGDRLRPLPEVLAQEQSEVMIAYATQRCAALFLVVIQRMDKNPSATQDLIDTWKRAADFLTQTSLFLIADQQRMTLDEAGEVVADTMLKISKLYDREMENHYLRTGNSFDKQIENDILACTEIHSTLKEGLDGAGG